MIIFPSGHANEFRSATSFPSRHIKIKIFLKKLSCPWQQSCIKRAWLIFIPNVTLDSRSIFGGSPSLWKDEVKVDQSCCEKATRSCLSICHRCFEIWIKRWLLAGEVEPIDLDGCIVLGISVRLCVSPCIDTVTGISLSAIYCLKRHRSEKPGDGLILPITEVVSLIHPSPLVFGVYHLLVHSRLYNPLKPLFPTCAGLETRDVHHNHILCFFIDCVSTYDEGGCPHQLIHSTVPATRFPF